MRSRKAVVETIRTKLNFAVEPPLRDQLLARAMQEQEQSFKIQPAQREPTIRRMIMKISTTRIAVAALIGAGVVTAATVGVGIHKFRFVEKRPEQGYIVQSEDGYIMTNIPENHASSPEQAVAMAEEREAATGPERTGRRGQNREEIALVKQQQGQRELVGVDEIEVNGQLDGRVLIYRHNLSDGRTITEGEGGRDDNTPWTLNGERHAEASRLLRQAKASVQFVTTDQGIRRLTADGKEIPTFERVIQGRTFVFQKYEFTLSDGAQVAWSIGTLKDSQ